MADEPLQQLFYRDPQPVLSDQHTAVRLQTGDFSFAKGAVCVPVVIGEFAHASRNYPVLFASGDDNGPIVLLGLGTQNLFIDGTQWASGTYVPAYVRRYPFGLMSLSNDGDQLVLCMDMGCPWVVPNGEEGRALFENGKEATQLTKDALEFCSRFAAESNVTREFKKALIDKGLLLDRRLDGKLPDGRPFAVDGFQIIDDKKLTELDADTLVDWHRKGWLACAYYHLASLDRVNELVARQADQPLPPMSPMAPPAAIN